MTDRKNSDEQARRRKIDGKDYYMHRAEERDWIFDPVANTDTLTPTDFEPRAGADIGFRFRLCTPEKEAEMLTACLRKRRMHPSVAARLLSLLEGKSFGLPEEEKSKRIREAGECLVASAAEQVWKPLAFKSQRDLNDKIKKTYTQLRKHYEQSKQTEKARSLDRRYHKFLEKKR